MKKTSTTKQKTLTEGNEKIKEKITATHNSKLKNYKQSIETAFHLLDLAIHFSAKNYTEDFNKNSITSTKKAEKENIPSCSIYTEENSITIKGDITKSLYEKVSKYLAEDNIKLIIINSNGGDIDAGISIGHLIYKYNLDIEVFDRFISSCANYLFTAAVNKTIRDGAAVIWHGNTQQKDFREFDLCGRTVSSLNGFPMDDEEIAEQNTPEMQQEWEARRQREYDFYQLIGVNDYIARVGQEPKNYGNFTMPVKHMLKFGVANVQAPKDYGEVGYCNNFNKLNSALALSCISVSEEHFNYENDRQKFGERCSHDGTLTINTSTNDLPIRSR